MTNYEKIEYAMQLEEEKEELKRKLQKINEQIDENMKVCNHAIVVLGNKETRPHYGKTFCCLICKKYFAYNEYPEIKYPSVDARCYLKNKYDDSDAIQRSKKFDIIRTIALGILKENNQMDSTNLCMTLDEMFKKSKNNQNISTEEKVKTYVKK